MASLDSLSDELLSDVLSRVPQKQTLTSLPRVCRWGAAEVGVASMPVFAATNCEERPSMQAVPRHLVGADQGLGALGQRFCSGVLAP